MVYEKFWFELPIVLKQAPSKSKIRDTVHLDQTTAFESIPHSVDLDLEERVRGTVPFLQNILDLFYLHPPPPLFL